MLPTKQNKHKNIHTLINIGLIMFLGFVGTVGTISLGKTNYAPSINSITNIDATMNKKNVLICAIGRCIFV